MGQYNAQITKDRVAALCKENGITIKVLQQDLNLGANAISQISDTKGMASGSLYRIADRLGTSVDYLLGRTDIKKEPDFNNEAELSPLDRQLAALISQLTDEQKQSILQLIRSFTTDAQ